MKFKHWYLVPLFLVPGCFLFSTLANPFGEEEGGGGEDGENYISEEEDGDPDLPIVYLDPGHGGHDAGATGEHKVEKEYNLDMALRTKRLLEDKGFKPLLTRDKDQFVSHDQRARMINKVGPALVVSIHHNSHASRTVSGVEIYLSKNSDDKLAAVLMEEMTKATKAKERGVKRTTYTFLDEVEVGEVVAVECGFLSNRIEADKVDTEEYREKMAEGITKGILRYLLPEKYESE